MSDIVTTQIFSAGETGITATKLNNIVGQSSIQTSFVSGQPLASSIGTTDQFLLLTSGGTYARVPQSTLISSVSGSLTPAGVGQAGIVNALSGKSYDYIGGDNACHTLLYSTGRSFNAVGNPNFEVDQRNVGVGQTNPGNGAWLQDRWSLGNSALLGTVWPMDTSNTPVLVPGTNFSISRACMTVSVNTVKSSLAVSDLFQLQTIIEGSAFRELSQDVHSISLMVRSSVAGLKFSVALRDNAAAKSLVSLCTIPSANAWTLITIPNIPIWTGTFSSLPGNIGYYLSVTLAAGSNFIAPATGTWQTGNYLGASGMSNFWANAVNSTFQIGFVQHEPGPVCTTLIDKPFSQNYDECLRYYCKSYDYDAAIASTSGNGAVTGVGASPALIAIPIPAVFPKPMAKVPVMSIYNHTTGAGNSIYNSNTGTSVGVASSGGVGKTRMSYLTLSATPAAGGNFYSYQFTADTGW